MDEEIESLRKQVSEWAKLACDRKRRIDMWKKIVDNMQKRLEDLQSRTPLPENPWISVDDEMPPEGLWVRVWGKWASSSQKEEEEHHCYLDRGSFNKERLQVTYWQRIVGPKKKTSLETMEELGLLGAISDENSIDETATQNEMIKFASEAQIPIFQEERDLIIQFIETYFSRSKKQTSPTMVEAPCEGNMMVYERDPEIDEGLPPVFKKSKAHWWSNTKDHRLWYWHNDQWHRAT